MSKHTWLYNDNRSPNQKRSKLVTGLLRGYSPTPALGSTHHLGPNGEYRRNIPKQRISRTQSEAIKSARGIVGSEAAREHTNRKRGGAK